MKQLLAWTACGLALVACCLSGYLLVASLSGGGVVGCTWSAFDCDAALASRWGKWFGVPVAAGGLLSYVTALVGAMLAGKPGRVGDTGWRLLEAVTPLAIGAAVWFIAVQFAALGTYCIYCLLTHLAGLLMAGVVIAWRLMESSDETSPAPVGLSVDGSIPVGQANPSGGPPSLGLPTVAGVLGVALLAAGQLLGPASAVAQFEAKLDEDFTFEAPAETPALASKPVSQPITVTAEKPVGNKPTESRPLRRPGGSRPLTLLGGKLQIDAYDHPVLGSPEAPHLVVELMDYACPHCREFHEKLTEAVRRFDGQVGVVVMFVPGEIVCNPYVRKSRKKSAGACYAAKLSLAVSRLEPERFERFHHWMLQDEEKVRSRTASLIEARRHVDGSDLSAEIRDSDGELDARIKQYVQLAAAIQKLGKFGLPCQILGNDVVSGPPESLDTLCDLWAEKFGIEQAGSGTTESVELPF